MQTRTVALVAASAGAAAAMAVTGVTYASAAGSSPQSVQKAVPASAPLGGDGEHKDNNDKKGDYGGGDYGKGGYGGGGYDRYDHDRIHVNERTYSAHPGECISVINLSKFSPFEAKSFNVRNDSRKTVEFFNGLTCDNGAPIATIGPRSSSYSINTRDVHGGGDYGRGDHDKFNVGSFRVIEEKHYQR